MTALLKQFEIGRPQIIAACFLLALLLQAVRAIYRAPITADEFQIIRDSIALKTNLLPAPALSSRPRQPADIPDSIFVYRLVGLAYSTSNFFERHAFRPLDPTQKARMAGVHEELSGITNPKNWKIFEFILRLPFALFGVWLGGALWWVSRRLFGNPGGYVALVLFCFSPWVIAMSSRINADVVAAWGLFGVIYTAIGVAHTLYAPPRSWPPRVLLLAAAFGFTFSAHLLAGLAGAILAFAFMMYLAVGRRRAAITVLAISLGIAALFLWASYGFSAGAWASLASGLGKLGWTHPEFMLHAAGTPSWFSALSNVIFLALEIASIYTLALWPRTRYFGNNAPWIVCIALAPLALLTGSTHADPWMWILPFIFLFVGGMSADWLESRRRRPALIALSVLLSVYAVASILSS